MEVVFIETMRPSWAFHFIISKIIKICSYYLCILNFTTYEDNVQIFLAKSYYLNKGKKSHI